MTKNNGVVFSCGSYLTVFLLCFGGVAFAQAQPAPTLTLSPAEPSGLDDVTLAITGVDTGVIAASNWEVAIDPAFEKVHISVTRNIENTLSDEELVSVTLQNSFFPLGQTFHARVSYADDTQVSSDWSNTVSFTMAAGELANLNVVYSEDFEGTEVFTLPEGWEEFNVNPDPVDPPEPNVSYLIDFYSSGAFWNPQLKSWTVVEYGDFLFGLPWYPTWENKDENSRGVVETDMNLAQGKLVHSDSASFDSNTAYYEAHLLSPEIDLTGVTDVVVAFNSNYVQNQDNIVVVEYTLDGGSVDMPSTPEHGTQPERPGTPTGTWYPVLYYMDVVDVMVFDGVVDMEGTLLGTADGTEFFYEDYVFAKAHISYEDLAPFMQPRIDDNATDGKRFERIRLPGLDNQSSVRFRWMMMGTYSWYFGFDNFQILGVGGVAVDDWSLY